MKIYSALLILLLASCTAKLPKQYYTKTLVETNYVENVKNNYNLHYNSPVKPVKIEVKSLEKQWETSAEKQDSTLVVKNQEHRPYFNLISGNDTTVVANRQIYFKKAVNFRDIGGLKTKDGRTVQWGKIYRSDNLSKLKSGEFAKFEDLHIRTVFDLRTSHEIKGKEDHLPANVKHIHSPTVADNEGQIAQLRTRVINGDLTEEDAQKLTVGFYRDAVSINVDSLRSIIHQILDKQEPVLYHCSAGKDRTGIVSALILSIFNVDRETIMKEYLMSNYYRSTKNSKTLGKAKAARIIKPKINLKAITVLTTVDESFMLAVFDTIDRRYGGMDQFITNQLGFNNDARKQLIAKYTY